MTPPETVLMVVPTLPAIAAAAIAGSAGIAITKISGGVIWSEAPYAAKR